MSLGDRLKSANEARAAEKSKQEIRARESDRMKYDAERRTILAFLEGIKENLTADIMNDVTPKPVKIPTGEPFNHYTWNGQDMIGKFTMMNHKHYSAFQTFFDWADQNGLVGMFLYAHDGVGVSSWHIATVEPKK
ncbi:hypothetical protein PHIM7_295 [Sinorhizobium phage phiM7]|uniref:Uncharacterized protein n=2 Tax=Emdodecavirus TaxID=1980937 RepID=S5MDG7_9CAUD|nr:hypothetical protein AB690_gp216 [Sinorhizobium phage phiM12]YP_009601420.1 hypothetical protein FDH46_gp183 [Sinorhizobium phage phiM7]AGR48014.1 hypothetical protein SmphiM12_382 [Sinorhizobium phage phiM12]AKF12841.1 hypothetical protein PHIM7_295 [Sinorhizobium phage phiM7]AKF13200.1 hypothetical protein PHIM19_295 [Sinorhizobium phage phiM19]